MINLLLLTSAALAMNGSYGTGPHYRDNNENGALDKDTWLLGSGGLWRSFLRVCDVPESSSFILQGLRDKDGYSIISRFNFFNWTQFRCLPTEAGRTAQDNATWLLQKLHFCQHAVESYGQSETDARARSYGWDEDAEKNGKAAETYKKLKKRAEAAVPLLERVQAYYSRKAWVETHFAYIRGTHVRQHTQLQYTAHNGTVHNYDVVEDPAVTNNSQIVFERSSGESCADCPDRLVMSEQFANDPRLTGTDKDGKPHTMYLYYTVENGWRVHYTDQRFFFNNRDVTVKFLNFQDAANPMGYQPQYY